MIMFVVEDDFLFEMDEYIKHSYNVNITKPIIIDRCPINKIKNMYITHKFIKNNDIPQKIIVGF